MSNSGGFSSIGINVGNTKYTVNKAQLKELTNITSSYNVNEYTTNTYNNDIYNDATTNVITLDELKNGEINDSNNTSKNVESNNVITDNPYDYEYSLWEKVELEACKRICKISNTVDKLLDAGGPVTDYAATAVQSFSCGVLGVFEDIGDGIIMAGGMELASLAEKAGKDELANDIKNITTDAIDDDWSEELYQENVKTLGVDEEIANSGVHTVGSMAGSIVTYITTGNVLAGFMPLIGMSSSMGSSSEVALQSGATFEETSIVSTVSGIIGFITGGITDKLGANAASAETMKQVFKYGGVNALASMTEPVVNSITEYFVYGKDMVNEDGTKKYDNIADYYKDSGGLLNTIFAGVTGGGTTVLGNVKIDLSTKFNSLIDNIHGIKDDYLVNTSLKGTNAQISNNSKIISLYDRSKAILMDKSGKLDLSAFRKKRVEIDADNINTSNFHNRFSGKETVVKYDAKSIELEEINNLFKNVDLEDYCLYKEQVASGHAGVLMSYYDELIQLEKESPDLWILLRDGELTLSSVVRSDNSCFSLKKKGTVDINGKQAYSFECGDNIIYSDIDLIERYTKGSTAERLFIKDEFLSNNRINSNVNLFNGYLGSYNFDDASNSFKKVRIENRELLIGQKADQFLSFFEDARKNDSNLDFGVDQNTSKSFKHIWRNDNGDYQVGEVNYESISRTIENLSLKYNMHVNDILNTIMYLDNLGACSYAAQCNRIFAAFKDDSIAFEKIFGYKMFEEIDGNMVLNSKTLMADMYIFANIDKNGGKIFGIDENGATIVNKFTDRFINAGRNISDPYGMIDTSEQQFLSWSGSLNDDLINRFLKANNPNCSASSKVIYSPQIDNQLDIEVLKKDIKNRLILGEQLHLGQRRVIEEPINFWNLDNPNNNVVTSSWNEGGAHATAVVGVNDQGLIISSWGQKFLVKFEDLTENNFSLISQKISH